MSDVKIEEITPSHTLGEGPHWADRDQSLIYVDIPEGNLNRYSLRTNTVQTLHIDDGGKSVSFVVPVEGEKDVYAAGVGTTLSLVHWPEGGSDYQTRKPYRLLTVDKHVADTRFNDAKCDPKGRLWAGTTDNAYGTAIEENKGSLYRVFSNLESTRMLEELGALNQRNMYYIDSSTRKMRQKKNSFGLRKANGKGSGCMTIDVNDKLWIACFGGAQVIHVDPTVGKVERIIKFPSLQTTSCSWGGRDYSTLFVTSANLNLTPEEAVIYPSSGKVFSLTGLGTKGLPAADFKLNKEYVAQFLKH
ncbi:Regucalcin [Armadillidium vulgare]|nr:Regucalcin [Armadillidium vulgare]